MNITKIDFSSLPYEEKGNGNEVVGDYEEFEELDDMHLCLGLVANTTLKPKILTYYYALFGAHMGNRFLVFDIRELFSVEDFDWSVLPIKGEERIVKVKEMILERFDTGEQLINEIVATKPAPIQM